MTSSPTFYSIIEYLYISSKCVSGANETNCALNVMSPTGLRNSPSPGLAGLHGVSAYPLQGKLVARWLTRRERVLPGSRQHGSSPGESASPLRGKLRPARLEESSGAPGLMEFTGRE